ncbi:hypothetical protein [Pacificispira sp.]|uniref:hypothetical protein n=1 Tax=Pacificispira sp. TaxID=2888761 RepID=UPI003BACE9DA
MTIIQEAFETLRGAAKERGVIIHYGETIEEYRSLCHEGDCVPGAPFEGVEPGGFLFLAGRLNGVLMHRQAFRLKMLAGTAADDLAGFWLRYHQNAADGSLPAEPFTTAPAALERGGRVAYHGDLWIERGAGGVGLQAHLSDILPKIGLFLAAHYWAPNTIYGIVEPRKVLTGLAARWGYTRMQPGAMRWEVAPPDIPRNEWIVAITDADLEHLAGEIMEWGLPVLSGWSSRK